MDERSEIHDIMKKCRLERLVIWRGAPGTNRESGNRSTPPSSGADIELYYWLRHPHYIFCFVIAHNAAAIRAG